MNVWMRGLAAGSMASQHRSMSLWAVRDSPQMVGPSIVWAMAWTASKSPWLAIGNPADGPYVLDSVRRTGGSVGHVSDEEVVAGIRLLARTEGVFAETAGGVTIATTRKLLEAGALDPDAETVLMITGDGLKTLDAVSGEVGPTATVPSTSAAVREALANRG